MGREDFSVYKPSKIAEGETVQMSYTREVVDGVTPFFREKPKDQALVEGEPLHISCLVASEPRAAIHWRGKVYLNLEPANILVCSGRSLGRSVQVKIANFETTQTVASSGTQIKGTYTFDS